MTVPGAYPFVRLPPEGETITWVALDTSWRPISSGSGVVRWQRSHEDGADHLGGHEDNGFGVEFPQRIDLSQVAHQA